MNTPGIMLGLARGPTCRRGRGRSAILWARSARRAPRRRCSRCATIVRCTRGFATAPAWRDGAWKRGEEIPTRINGQARPIEDITRDINRAFEAAVRRDPANWFWVHNRWKTPKNPPRSARAKPAAAQPAHQLPLMSTERILVRGVNWLGDAIMTTPGVDAVARSEARRRTSPCSPRESWLSCGGIIRRSMT